MTIMADNIPDVVVGVDFGTDSTGKPPIPSFASTPSYDSYRCKLGELVDHDHVDSDLVGTISDWPSRDGKVLKSRTRLLYEGNRVIKWGDLIEPEDITREARFCRTYFKRFLDPKLLQSQHRYPQLPVTDAEVDKLVKDYLSKVHSHLEQLWRNQRVDFIFSIPTTWNDKPHVVQRFKTLFRDAGFGRKGDLKHRAFIGDTEPVAAVVYMLSNQGPPQEYSVGDIILVCDVGGGTTDLALLKVTSTDPELPCFDILYAPVGRNVGSSDIDEGAFDIFSDQLKQVLDDPKVSDDKLVSGMALSLVEGWFQRAKRSFGNHEIEVPISPDQNHVNDDEETAEDFSTISDIKLQKLFDAQIEKIMEAIDSVLSHTEQCYPYQQISNLVLCGGLGSSKYVQRRFKEYLDHSSEKRPCTAGLKLKTFDERTSRGCVSAGLVHREMQNLARGIRRSDVEMLCNPRSFGVEITEKYDRKIHDSAQVTLRNKKPYVSTIKWIIEADKGYRLGESYEQSLNLKIKDEKIPNLSVKVYRSAPSNHANLQSRPRKSDRAYPGSDGVEFLQELRIDLPSQETPEMSLWSKIRRPASTLDFRAVAELHGIDLVFKLKCADHESAPSLPIRGDWQEFKGDYVPPFAGAGS